jgi:transitional endoplasmic reticulum ATPase
MTQSTPQKKEYNIVREGDRFVIPKRLDWPSLIATMQVMRDQEEKMVSISEEIDAYPLEGAYAFHKVINEKYGWSNLVDPSMISIEVAPGVMEQVPWGKIKIPGMDGDISTGYNLKEGRFIFRLQAYVKGKFKEEIAEIAANVRSHVSDRSIYKGKAIRVTFPDPDDSNFSPLHSPKFMDVTEVKPESLVFSREVNDALDVDIFLPIQHSDELRRRGISLKRAVLLAGPYGTGKTLTAYVAAKLAVNAGSTFLYLTNARDLPRAIHFARNYGRVVIFAEDVDSVMESRNADMEAAFDGFETKGSEVHVIGTTNHLEKVSPAMRRQGRFDNIVNILPPDAEAVGRLIRMYAKNDLPKEEDISPVCDRLAGNIPAAIHEVVKRATIYAVGKSIRTGKEVPLSVDILDSAASAVLSHISLTREAKADDRSSAERAAAIIGNFISNGISRASLDPQAQKALNAAPLPPSEVNGKHARA